MSAITELAGSPRSPVREPLVAGAAQRERFERALAGQDEGLPLLRPQLAGPGAQALREDGIQGEVVARPTDETEAFDTGSSLPTPVSPVAAALPMVAAATQPAPCSATGDHGDAAVAVAGVSDAMPVADAMPATDAMPVAVALPRADGTGAADAGAVQRSAVASATDADARAFAALVDQARVAQRVATAATAASDGGFAADAAAAAMGVARGELPMQLPTALPTSASPSPADAARLADWLLRHNPMVVTGNEPVRMSFPPGSGPIDQIVFSREAGALSVLVSSAAGTRELVQRSLGDLERRLRERGLAVAGVRMADAQETGSSGSSGTESAGADARY